MKKLTLIVFILPLLSVAQTDSNISYTYIHESPLTKKELFSNAKKWVATNFNNYKAVVSYDDLESGEISGSGEFSFIAGLTTGATYKFSISTKEEKYRLKIENIELKSLLGYMKEMYSEKVVQYQKREYDSLSNIIDSLGKIDISQLKKSGVKNIQLKKQATASELRKNLTPLIEPYFNKFDESLHMVMSKKDDF
ncbi:MAG TPA: DUF4468 domain-containing protein [Niabella sp.]|nr:DUF4468 domain-containing protein [Niabella sp.]